MRLGNRADGISLVSRCLTYRHRVDYISSPIGGSVSGTHRTRKPTIIALPQIPALFAVPVSHPPACVAGGTEGILVVGNGSYQNVAALPNPPDERAILVIAAAQLRRTIPCVVIVGTRSPGQRNRSASWPRWLVPEQLIWRQTARWSRR
jgi:hypothetical protein